MPRPTPTEPILRIGAVNYLNSRPLVYRLAERAPDCRVLFDLPSRLADSLAAGRLDVALIPVVECFRQPGYRFVSDACVASNGPVRSVKLYFRRPPAEVRRLALDEGSRTSAALARVLLRHRFGLAPEMCRLPIGSSAGDAEADAVLLIGDRAMLPPAEPFVEAWDLATEWRRWTGLPFVFACWVARSHAAAAAVSDILTATRDDGVANVDAIAAKEAPKLDLDASAAREYLTENLHFQLGVPEQKALERFRAECNESGILSPATALPEPGPLAPIKLPESTR